MGASALPLQIATVGSALIWPLVAGVAVVVWSKVRAARHARRMRAMEGELQGFYRSVEIKPVPSRLSMVVDALEEGEELGAGSKPQGQGEGKRDAGAKTGS